MLPAILSTPLRRLVGLVLGLGLAACSPNADAGATEAQAVPTRIVALTIGSVDTLALLGELGRVVAVEADCFVPGTEDMVKIKNDDHAGPPRALNVESVLALRPDLVIAKAELRPALDQRGVPVLWIPEATDLESIIGVVRDIGARLHAVEKTEAVIAQMRAQADSIARQVAGCERVTVYYEAGRPGRTAGRGTVIDDMIRLAGGVNVAGTLPLANPVLSSEAIVAANPQVIVLSPWCDSPEEVARRPGWDRIDAVVHHRVHRIPERERKVQYPSPSCLDGCASMLVPWLHPELAKPEPAVR